MPDMHKFLLGLFFSFSFVLLFPQPIQAAKYQGPIFVPRAPFGATAKCRDTSYSFSHTRRGTCSYHGGVARWL